MLLDANCWCLGMRCSSSLLHAAHSARAEDSSFVLSHCVDVLTALVPASSWNSNNFVPASSWDSKFVPTSTYMFEESSVSASLALLVEVVKEPAASASTATTATKPSDGLLLAGWWCVLPRLVNFPNRSNLLCVFLGLCYTKNISLHHLMLFIKKI